VLGLATYIGQIGGQAIGPAIALRSDWRAAFEIIGGAGLIMGFLLVVLVREPRRVAPGPVKQIRYSEVLARLRHARSYVLMMLAFALGTLSGVAFGQWGPELFARNYGVAPEEAKSAFALYFAIAGITGMLSFGALMDRAVQRGPEWPVRMSAWALFAATLCILTVTWVPSFTAAKLLAIPSGLLGGGWAIGLLAALQYILPDRFRATATATFIMVTTLIGYLVGPWLAGAISSALGDDALSLQIGLTAAIPFGFVAAILAWLAISRVEADKQTLSLGA
jgi:MFS family permease